MDLSRTSVAGERAGSLRFGLLDPVLLVTGLALSFSGILAVYIAGSDEGQSYAMNQALGFLAGLVGAVPLALLDYRRLKNYLPLIYGVVIIMLLIVEILGISVMGGQRWIDIGPVRIQPSEFAKLFMVVVLAGYFSEHRISDNVTFLKALGILGIPALLVFAQPDLGTALVFGAMFFAMAFVGGAKLYQLGALALSGVAAFALAIWVGLLKEYQIARLTTFLDPVSAGVSDEGYQVLQSKIAIGSGGVTGKGFDAITLGNLGFLPEDHTDFIFSNLAERTGFIGGILLLGLFFILVWRILRVATVARDRFGVLLAVGIGTIFLFHVFVNVGMTMGLMPVTGIPLPFISYGRSSLVVSVLCLGLLQSIVMRSKAEGYKGADV